MLPKKIFSIFGEIHALDKKFKQTLGQIPDYTNIYRITLIIIPYIGFLLTYSWLLDYLHGASLTATLVAFVDYFPAYGFMQACGVVTIVMQAVVLKKYTFLNKYLYSKYLDIQNPKDLIPHLQLVIKLHMNIYKVADLGREICGATIIGIVALAYISSLMLVMSLIGVDGRSFLQLLPFCIMDLSILLVLCSFAEAIRFEVSDFQFNLKGFPKTFFIDWL